MNTVSVFVGSRSNVFSLLNLELGFAVTSIVTYFLTFHLLTCLRLFHEPIVFLCSFQFHTLGSVPVSRVVEILSHVTNHLLNVAKLECFMEGDRLCLMTLVYLLKSVFCFQLLCHSLLEQGTALMLGKEEKWGN